MGTTLTGTTPQDTYDSLIKVTDNGPLSGSLKTLTDGLGNDSALALSTGAASVTGTLAVTAGTNLATASGNVGIGIAVPARKLEVMDSLRVTTAGTSRYFDVTEGTIKLYSSNAEPSIKFADYNTGLDRVATIGYEGDFFGRGALSFVVKEQGSGTAAEAMRLTAAGNVGIGTSSPTGKLTVRGEIDTIADIAGAGYGSRISNPFNGVNAYDLAFSNRTNSGTYTEVGRFLAAGGLTFNGDTAAANALDDYEEGTWTPNIIFGGGSTGVIYSGINAGTYTKIGRKVTVNGHLDIANKGTSTGAAQISNLPFTIGSGSGNYGSPSFRPVNISFADMFIGYGDVGGNTITLQEITNAGTISSITDADFATTTNLIFSFTYFV